MTQANHSRITPDMFMAIVPAIIARITHDALEQNPLCTAFYLHQTTSDGGAPVALTSTNNHDLSLELTNKLLVDHGAIRAFTKEGSNKTALQGIKPFVERWHKLGFIHLNKQTDVYNFASRQVSGLHIEVIPQLAADCDIHNNHPDDPHYFRWFMSDQPTTAFPKQFKGLTECLDNSTDPMTKTDLSLLDKVSQGNSLTTTETEQLIDAMYLFMTQPFTKIDAQITHEWETELNNLSKDSNDYLCGEYAISGVHSKINHVAYLSSNVKKLAQAMQAKELKLTPFQSSQDGKLEQFGSPAAKLEHKWQEFIQRHSLTDNLGNNINHQGQVTEKTYLKRTFEARNANNLFSAGTPK